MSLPIVTMGELDDRSLEFGNKVKNLASLAQAGIRVPRGFGLPSVSIALTWHKSDLFWDVYVNRRKNMRQWRSGSTRPS